MMYLLQLPVVSISRSVCCAQYAHPVRMACLAACFCSQRCMKCFGGFSAFRGKINLGPKAACW